MLYFKVIRHAGFCNKKEACTKMKSLLKKSLSVFLALCCVFTALCSSNLVSSVKAARSPIPVVYIRGYGFAIYKDTNDSSSEQLSTDILSDEAITNTVKELAVPLVKAYLKNDFTEYCDLLAEKFEPYYSAITLDENGEIANGSGNKCNQVLPSKDTKKNGTYDIFDYIITYDWRIDPFETAKWINEYIEKVKELTGSDKVNVVCRCLGVNIFLAYVAEYGYDSINSVVMYAGGLDGFEYAGSIFSGNVSIDADSLERYINSSMSDADETQRIMKSLVQVMNSSFLLEWGIKEVMDFYQKIYENVLPRLLRESHGSFPAYWSMVPAEDYDAAIELNFGKEKEKYAGLIEKLDRYHNTVSVHVDDIINSMIKDGVKVYDVVKYGFAMIPVSGKKSALQSDGTLGVVSASGGAVVSEVGKTLTDKYIENAKTNGTAEYISPDKTIDASTGLLADHTWYIKNLAHDPMPRAFERDLFATLLASETYMTVFDDSAHPQYLIYNDSTGTGDIMTEDNCHTDEEDKWESDTGESSSFLLSKMFDAIMKIVQIIRDFITNLLAGIKGTV